MVEIDEHVQIIFIHHTSALSFNASLPGISRSTSIKSISWETEVALSFLLHINKALIGGLKWSFQKIHPTTFRKYKWHKESFFKKKFSLHKTQMKQGMAWFSMSVKSFDARTSVALIKGNFTKYNNPNQQHY